MIEVLGQFGGYKVSPLAAHEADLRRWVAERSEITIAELQTLLSERGTRTSPAALARFLAKLGLTRRKKAPWAAEQSREDVAAARQAWLGWQRGLNPKKLVFVDETWTSTASRRHRHSRQSQQSQGRQH